MFEAAEILGCSRSTVYRLIKSGALRHGPRYAQRPLDREEVERLSADRWRRPRTGRRRRWNSSYWITGPQVAELLGVGRARVAQVAREGRLPYVETSGGDRLYRRRQVEVIANAMLARRESKLLAALVRLQAR
ncbi:MAG: helix-turn-helix domain-containing protein [Actinomycetota bacterium]